MHKIELRLGHNYEGFSQRLRNLPNALDAFWNSKCVSRCERLGRTAVVRYDD